MITTEILKEYPTTIYQKLTELTDEPTTRNGAVEGRELVEQFLQENETFNLIVDVQVKTDGEYNLFAHRAWATEFKEHPTITSNVRRAAIVGEDSQKFRMEKEHLTTETLHFFNDLDEAISWVTAI